MTHLYPIDVALAVVRQDIERWKKDGLTPRQAMAQLGLTKPWDKVAFAAVGKWMETKKELDRRDEDLKTNGRQDRSTGRSSGSGNV